MDQPLKVFIVDDTVTYRKILSDAVSSMPEAEVVGTASSGHLALKKLEHTEAELVLLDVFMPDMDGVETLARLRQQYPQLFVVMVSGATDRDAEITLKALEDGAMDFIPKPQVKSFEEGMRMITGDLKRIIRLVNIRRYTKGGGKSTSAAAGPAASRDTAPGGDTTTTPAAESASPTARPATRSPAAPPRSKTPTPQPSSAAARGPATPGSGEKIVRKTSGPRPSSIDLLVIGVSTGGPNALNVVIPNLPGNLPCPVLIVQHMPPMFTASLAAHLDKASRIQVREAVDGEPIVKGTALIAPGGRHMELATADSGDGYTVSLNDNPPVHSCRPAVDVLFHSVAKNFKGGVLSVILTGMGEDGANGVAALKAKGCISLAQNEKTCVVYGMPRAVVERNMADEILPIEDIAPRIAEISTRKVFT